MFLKNSLTNGTASVRTSNGLIILKAQEVIKIETNDIRGRYPSCVIESNEQEYLKYINKDEEPTKTEVEVEVEVKNENGEEMLDDKQKESLDIQIVDNRTEKEILEEKIEMLKKTWLNTSRAKKKEQLQNEIKELQDKLEKLQ